MVGEGDLLMLGEPIAYRTPIYPWFLSFLRLAPIPLLTVAIAQALMYLASVWMASELAPRISGYASARVITLLILLPAISATSYLASLLTETLFVFVLMLNLTAVMAYAKYESAGSMAFAGFTFAITLLTRPIVLLLWVAHVALVFFIQRRRVERWGMHVPVSGRRRIVHGMLAVVVVAFLIAPWLGRNYHLFGKPFLTEFLGRNIWIVTFQDGSGSGLEMPSTEASEELKKRLSDANKHGDWSEMNWRHTWTVSSVLVQSGLDDAQADRLMKSVATQAMWQDIPNVAYKSVRRTINFWRCPATDLPYPAPDFQGFDDYPATWSVERVGLGGIVLANQSALKHRLSQSVLGNTVVMFVIGGCVFVLLVRRGSRPCGIWVLLMLLYFCAVTGIVEIPDYRYRLVIEPIAAMTVGGAVASLWGKLRGIEPEPDLEIDG